MRASAAAPSCRRRAWNGGPEEIQPASLCRVPFASPAAEGDGGGEDCYQYGQCCPFRIGGWAPKRLTTQGAAVTGPCVSAHCIWQQAAVDDWLQAEAEMVGKRGGQGGLSRHNLQRLKLLHIGWRCRTPARFQACSMVFCTSFLSSSRAALKETGYDAALHNWRYRPGRPVRDRPAADKLSRGVAWHE